VNEAAERMARFIHWSEDGSYGVSALRDRHLYLSRAATVVRLAESLYPNGEAGQVVLGTGLDPVQTDAVFEKIRCALSLIPSANASETSPVWCSETGRKPRAERLVLTGEKWAGKPQGALFTSTGSADYAGAWSTYALTIGMDTESWSYWALTARQARILNVDSAVEWCTFAYDFMEPSGAVNWADVSTQWDAVHISAAAVAATDCFEFSWRDRTIPAPFWGTETTVWLRWMFTEVRQWGTVSPIDDTVPHR
jgi:hypothetical protein